MTIYAGIKEEMIEMIEKWDFEAMSIDEMKQEKKKMMKYIEIAIYTKKRMDSLHIDNETKKRNTIAVHTSIEEEINIEEEQNKAESKQEKTTEVETEKAYPLKRLLSGGTLNNNIYVPEKMIRNLNAKNGDLIKAEFYRETPEKRKLYNYKLIEERNELDAEGRNQLSFGVIEYDESLHTHYIEEDIYHEAIYVNDIPTRMVVSQRDTESLKLETGDVVDIAWYDGHFNEAKVIWKYATEEIMSHPQKTQKKQSKKRAEHEPIELEQNLVDKKICLVGCEPYHAELRKVVEERGGEVFCLSGEEPGTTIESSIRKSDACVVAIQHVSHDASKRANSTAKEAEVPFESFSGYGRGQFLTAVYKSLNLLSFAG